MDRFSFREWSDTQRHLYDGAVQAYAAYQEALNLSRPFRGGMHWKNIKGRAYLYQYRDRQGHGSCLGPRSRHTEEVFQAFARQRRETVDRLRDRRGQLSEQARFCRAALIRRVPAITARILRRLGEDGSWGQDFLVISTQAIYAYEFAAGVFLEGPKTGALWNDAATALTLATEPEIPGARLLALLRRADRSFRVLPGEDFRVVNRTGFLVKVVAPGSRRPPRLQSWGPGDAGRQALADVGSLSHLLHAPKFSQVVIGWDGRPVTMVAPDPRAFALHKLWLSEPEGEEERQQARDQALAVAALILRYLPQYHFFSSELRLFPAEVRQGERFPEGIELTGDISVEY